MDAQESALVILVPEADRLVKRFRDQFDPAAASGIPAHITVLYPFMAPRHISPAVMARLSGLFAACAPFDVALAELRRFPKVLYLAPQPDDPFRRLTQWIVAHFPDCPPYGGAFAEITPHMTFAHSADPERLEGIARDFLTLRADQLPLRVRATEAALIDNEDGAWHVHATFPFRSD